MKEKERWFLYLTEVWGPREAERRALQSGSSGVVGLVDLWSSGEVRRAFMEGLRVS